VSLCEDYIAKHLLQSFLLSSFSPSSPYQLSIEIITPATPSPFKPFFLAFTKPKNHDYDQHHQEPHQSSTAVPVLVAHPVDLPVVHVFFDSFGSPLQHQEEGNTNSNRPLHLSLSVPATLNLLQSAHMCSQRRFQLADIRVGRYEIFDLHSSTHTQTEETETSSSSSIPRFSVIIYDHANRAPRSMAVFFVPQGRETDFQFTSGK
jgi:hypothetical protein